MNEKITYGELFKEFCACNPTLATKVADYRPWGNLSIVVWFTDGSAHKIKRLAPNRYTIQSVSQDDINKKFKLN